MSQENVEIVRKGFEYWNRGDFEAFMDFSDDDQVIRTAEGLRKGRRALLL